MNPDERDLRALFQRRAADVDDIEVMRSAVLARSKRRRVALPAMVMAAVVCVSAIATRAWTGEGPGIPVPPAGTPTSLETFEGHPGAFELWDDPSTERVEVASGEYEGVPWLIFLTRWDRDRDKWCLNLRWDGGSGSCTVETPDKYLNQGRGGGGGIEDVFGELATDVARVEVRLDGYEPYDVAVIEGPKDPGVNFYLGFVPGGSEGTISAFDSSGNLLESQDLLDLGGFDDALEDVLESFDESVSDRDHAVGSRCISEAVTILGTPGDDTLEGTDGPDVIAGLGGDDVISGLGGDDVVCGGPGNDTIDGGEGFDEIAGGQGDDDLDGGPGFDIVAYWDSPSGIRLDLTAGTAEGEGDDSVTGFEELGGSKHDDVLIGGDGDDQFSGAGGNDVLIGNGGDDLFYAGNGDDRFDGGSGRDAVVFEDFDTPEEEQGVVVDLEAGTARGQGNDTLASIEVIHGSRGDDTIRGSDANEVLVGRSGNDAIFGGDGDDVLWGDHLGERRGSAHYPAADDRLDGGKGADELHGGPGDNSCETDSKDSVEDC